MVRTHAETIDKADPDGVAQALESEDVDYARLVIDSTGAKIRTFLYELAEGTTNYRSLHGLTQQVEHQYHGRFLVELIQNAHDALFREEEGQSRIEIVLDTSDGPHGALYVANDGQPVTASNFTSLSQLGQSDKNPQESIGNKGIGFRSVLEISDSPEIYSRRTMESERFDGFCFGFSPRVIDQLAPSVNALFLHGLGTKSPFSDMPLVDWNETLLAKFRGSIGKRGPNWMAEELSYLSPYLLPVPVDRTSASGLVSAFEARNFMTLIRFPLKSAEALALVKRKMSSLSVHTALFLDRASSLVLDDGEKRRQLIRQATAYSESAFECQEITIASEAVSPAEHFFVWSRSIHVQDASADFQKAIQQLPGKWPELREARISIAVRKGDIPAQGMFNIFLPTLLRTGSATHINAPFFADMSRTDIDFEQPYNSGLLREAWALAIDVVSAELAGRGADEARAIIDLLTPFSSDKVAKERWGTGIAAQVEQAGLKFDEQPWLISDEGWSTLGLTSLLPVVPVPIVFTPAALRQHATFGVFDPCMDSRVSQLKELAALVGFNIYPMKSDLADTIEQIALAIHRAGTANWNAFWREVEALMEGDATPLQKHAILLGRDGELHSAGETCAVFFIPRQGTGEDDEFLSESAIVDIPPALQPHVAFLHDSIALYDEKNLRVQTATRRFLEKRLVNRFRVEDIFTEVLIRRTPTLPIGLKSPGSALCADILRWALKLLSNLAGRGRGDKTVRMLKDIAMPCRGGWYRASDASYGPGWTYLGSTLLKYLSGSKAVDCREAAKRLLLPPNHPFWDSNAKHHVELLEAAGVFDGLRLNILKPDAWKSSFVASWGAFKLTATVPPGVAAPLWEEYREHARTTRLYKKSLAMLPFQNGHGNPVSMGERRKPPWHATSRSIPIPACFPSTSPNNSFPAPSNSH